MTSTSWTHSYSKQSSWTACDPFSVMAHQTKTSDFIDMLPDRSLSMPIGTDVSDPIIISD